MLLCLCLCLGAAQAEQVLRSPGTRVHLLELYTSEGCSSCPPADRWLSSLLDHEGLWVSVVPLSFHVDYWDYIGWKDRFASPHYTKRQRNYARAGALRTVYTPGFLLNGAEWRSFFGKREFPPASAEPAGELTARIHGKDLDLRYRHAGNRVIRAPLVWNIALLGSGIRTEVHAGENHGRSLRHDFVVLAWRTEETGKEGDAEYALEAELPPRQEQADVRYALAVWVHARHDLQPLQAVGGWLDP